MSKEFNETMEQLIGGSGALLILNAMRIGEDLLNTADMPSIVESRGDSSLTGEEVTVVKHLLGG